ncbi:insecticidal delta-endotoxin Cry8Ea1 family protein [Paenibacillus chitinolyticus]
MIRYIIRKVVDILEQTHVKLTEGQAQQVSSQRETGSPAFTVDKNGKLDSFKKELFSEVNAKSISTLMANTLTAALKDAQKDNGDFNDTFRTLAMAGAALIPYGGMFISPLIGLMWPEHNTPDTKALLEELRKELSKEMDTKIEDEHFSNLNTEFAVLRGDLKTLENSVNGKRSESFYNSQGTIQGTRRDWADAIQRAFKRLIMLTKQDTHKISDLPLYTSIAIAHMNFLTFIHLHGKGPKFQFAEKSLTDFYDKINETTESYVDHIAKTYTEGNENFLEKMKNIISDSSNISDWEVRLEKLTKERTDILKYSSGNILEQKRLHDLNHEIPKLAKDLSDYKKLVQDKKDFYNTTWDNEALKLIATGKWVEESGKWYFITKNGQKKFKWVLSGDKWYYLSPIKSDKFEQGQMMTGWVLSEDKYYYLSPTKTDKFEQGQMMTGWALDGNKWYYLSPKYNTTNYDGTKFEKGQRMTGWVKVEGEYYYLSPEETTSYDGEKLKKGQMVTGWLENKKKWYYLDKTGETGKKGSMIHDRKITVDGEEYHFDEKGVLK